MISIRGIVAYAGSAPVDAGRRCGRRADSGVRDAAGVGSVAGNASRREHRVVAQIRQERVWRIDDLLCRNIGRSAVLRLDRRPGAAYRRAILPAAIYAPTVAEHLVEAQL